MEDCATADGQAKQATLEGEEESVAGPDVPDLVSEYIREKPISILVGPEKDQYFIHKGLLAAKSPFFRTMFKTCWDGNKSEVELSQISTKGFSIVADWIYSGKLPPKVTIYSQGSEVLLENILKAYKAADILMIDKLQNELILSEVAYLRAENRTLTFVRLKQIFENDLCHTKYYAFALKSAMMSTMKHLNDPPEDWDEQMTYVEDNLQLLADILRTTRDWLREPWYDFLKGDLSEFLVKEAEE